MFTLVPHPWVIMVVYHGTSCTAPDAWTFARGSYPFSSVNIYFKIDNMRIKYIYMYAYLSRYINIFK